VCPSWNLVKGDVGYSIVDHEGTIASDPDFEIVAVSEKKTGIYVDIFALPNLVVARQRCGVKNINKILIGFDKKISQFKRFEVSTTAKQALSSQEYSLPKTKVGYLRVNALTVNDQVREKLEGFKNNNITTLVLDLRACQSLNAISGSAKFLTYWLGKNSLDLFLLKAQKKKSFEEDGDVVWHEKVIVLIDRDTQGNFEQIAAELQMLDNVVLTGTPTSGNGHINSFKQLVEDGVSDFFLLKPHSDLCARGERINGRPIQPDVALEVPVAVLGTSEESRSRAIAFLSELLEKTEAVQKGMSH